MSVSDSFRTRSFCHKLYNKRENLAPLDSRGCECAEKSTLAYASP